MVFVISSLGIAFNQNHKKLLAPFHFNKKLL
jgi:hypothetical protein